MIFWPWGLYRVAGHSMLPTYGPGDTLLGWHWFARPQIGQVIVVRTPQGPLVKRVGHIEGDLVWLVGDNPGDSHDSRAFGTINRADIEALVIAKLG